MRPWDHGMEKDAKKPCKGEASAGEIQSTSVNHVADASPLRVGDAERVWFILWRAMRPWDQERAKDAKKPCKGGGGRAGS
jgi:hypothetical protein